MTKEEACNIEEMTTKLVEYIWAVDSDDANEMEIDLLTVAAKFVIASAVERGKEICMLSGAEIVSRCAEVSRLCMLGGMGSNGGENTSGII